MSRDTFESEPVCGCRGKEKTTKQKQTNKKRWWNTKQKQEIIHGRDVFTFWYVGTPTELLPMTLKHIYFYGCRWYCVLREWKRMLDAFCAHSKIKSTICRPSLYFNYHSIRDYSSSRFCFQFAPTLCGLFTIFYIWLKSFLPPRWISFVCWRTSNHLLAEKKGKKQPAIPLFASSPKANPTKSHPSNLVIV